MFKEQYIKEISTFTLSENFKARTIALLEEKQQEYATETSPSKVITFRPTPNKKTVAVCACTAVVLLYGWVARFYIGSSSAMTGKPQVFTIEDVQTVEENSNPEFVVQAQYDNGGGMGYEGILLKDINEYDNGNPFSINDSFETLPVYQFTAPTLEQAESETEQLLKAFDADSDIAAKELTLTEIIYYEGHVSSHKDVTLTESEFDFYRTKFKNPMIPHRYETEFEGGDIQMWIPRGETRVTIDADVRLENNQIIEYIRHNYSDTFGYDSSVVYSAVDYNIYGEELPTYYIYKHSDDYAQNIFNFSVDNARVYYLAKEESLEDSDKFTFWIKNDCYTKGQELPAINWQQALGLLYKGDYYSSVPYEITSDSIVSRIELVYKDAPYNEMLLERSGPCLPFYKFYVEIKDMGIQEHGLEDYGIYYVCAINPNYVEITENYAGFN